MRDCRPRSPPPPPPLSTAPRPSPSLAAAVLPHAACREPALRAPVRAPGHGILHRASARLRRRASAPAASAGARGRPRRGGRITIRSTNEPPASRISRSRPFHFAFGAILAGVGKPRAVLPPKTT